MKSKKIIGMPYAAAAYAYYLHYNSNPYFNETREPSYTFFADMMLYIYLAESDNNALNEIQKYVKRMLKSYGKNRDAFCILVDSINTLGWYCYKQNGNTCCDLSDYLFNEYNRLMLREGWRDYITEDEFVSVYSELN